jgi:hypothetical protein
MIACDDVLEALFLGRALDGDARRHLGSCPRCAGEEAGLGRAVELLGASPAPFPPAGLSARVLGAAEPLLARHAGRARWRSVAAALAIGFVPLPLILLLDAALVRGAYALLSQVLPHALTLYFVTCYAAVLVVLLALTYASIPLLAERQRRALRMVHA